MKAGRIKCLFQLLFVLATSTAFTQTDTLRRSPELQIRTEFREKSYKLIFGGHLQQAYKPDGIEYSRKLIEIGIHRSLTFSYGHHPPGGITQGFSLEIAPESKPIVGFKYGGSVTVLFFVLGVNAVYYSDFANGNFKIRPEFGVGGNAFKLSFGYNIPTIGNRDLEALQRSEFQVNLATLFKIKTIERKEW